MVPFELLMASDPTLITASITALIMLSRQIKDHFIKNKKIDDTDFFHNLFKDIFTPFKIYTFSHLKRPLCGQL